MKLTDRITKTWENIASMTPESLQAVKYFLFGAVVIDVFGIYWYLEMKSLGSALLIVILACLGVIMFLETRNYEEKPERGNIKKMTIKCDECGREFRTQNELAQHIMAKHMDKKKKHKSDQRQNDQDREEEPRQESSGDAFGFGQLPDPEEYQRRMEKGLGGGIGF